ncbi:MAG TPA: ATP-binding cassette domain-containing protein [Pirellulales bacterium]|jgi:phospholipid/cholesterol/gamma-HCH transport system ATP-binding protein|nr:ATP-binding cassette domain-containing protein [Pirellulales bacterium]
MPTEKAPALIETRNLNVRYGRQAVLRNINIAVPSEQTLVVIGESGCGKTVLLKMLIGLSRPTSGEVLLEGHNLAQMNDQEIAQQRTRFGFLFQGAALFDSLTVLQNVAFPLKEHTSMSVAEIQQTVRDKIAEVGLPNEVLEKRPAELSGGMRKRVGLARALALNPGIILYDEPTTGLDPIMSDVINELILNTRKLHSVTSVIVTHDMNTVRKTADRVIMMFPLGSLKSDEPQIIFDGSPDALERSTDKRVSQFVRGEAGLRIREMQRAAN